MNYREKMREYLKEPNEICNHYGKWGILNREQRNLITRLLDELDSADNYIKNLYLENQKLKENYERIYNENCILREKHNINDIDLLDENYKLKQIIDKAIDLLNAYIGVLDDTSDLYFENVKSILELEVKEVK